MRVLFLDDDKRRCHAFYSWAGQMDWFQGVDFAHSAAEALELLAKYDYNVISLDHDLCEQDQNKREGFMCRTGFDVAQWLALNTEKSPGAKIIVHSYNDWGAARMKNALLTGRSNVEVKPFNWEDPSFEV